MAKKVEKNEDVVIEVNTDVVSSSDDVVDVADTPIAETATDVVKPKKTRSKKVSEIALEKQISEMEKSLLNAKSAIEAAAAENERLSDELSVAVAENKSLRKELSKCKHDFKKVQGDNRANSALVDTLDGELTRFKVRNKELMDTISQLQSKLKQYADELSGKDDVIGALKLERSVLDSKLDSMNLWNRIKYVFCGKESLKNSEKV